MNINRNNYEEYFILYVDNELSNADKKAVDNFIAQNLDLKIELDSLLLFKFEPDEAIVYSNKTSLFKSESDAHSDDKVITAANCGEMLLLYVDNELDVAGRLVVEEFVSVHPAFQKELLLLQKSVVVPEKIIFSDKKLLYRRKDKAPILLLHWRRIAVAAVFLLALGMIGYQFLIKPDKSESPIATNVIDVKKHIDSTSIETKVDVAKNAINVNQNTASSQKSEIDSIEAKRSLVKSAAVQSVVNKSTIKEEIRDDFQKSPANQRTVADVSRPLQQPIKNETASLNSIKQRNVNAMVIANPTVTKMGLAPSSIQMASLVEDGMEEDESGRKGNLRGFFRKITRVIEKRTNIEAANDDGKLLVAGLAFNLK